LYDDDEMMLVRLNFCVSVTPDPAAAAAAACYLSVRSNQDGLMFYCIAVLLMME